MNFYFKRSESNDLPYPTTADLLKLSSKGIEGLAFSLRSSVDISRYDDFGQLAFELVLMLLEQISKKMEPEQTLKDFFG